MNKKLHQGEGDKLVALQNQNAKLIKLHEVSFFESTFYQGAMSLEKFLKINNSQAMDVMRDVRNGMFDSQCEVQEMIRKEQRRLAEINEIKRKACTHDLVNFVEDPITEEYIRDMTQFQSLLNMTYERSIRKCYENSLDSFNQQLSNIIEQLERSLDVSLQENMDISIEHVLKAGYDPVFWCFMRQKQIL